MIKVVLAGALVVLLSGCLMIRNYQPLVTRAIGIVEGVVVDENTTEPLSGVRVTSYFEAVNWSEKLTYTLGQTNTDSQGHFSMPAASKTINTTRTTVEIDSGVTLIFEKSGYAGVALLDVQGFAGKTVAVGRVYGPRGK